MGFTFDDAYKVLFFGMAVYIVCLVVRRGLELAWPALRCCTRPAQVWRTFVLPALPVVLGGVAGGFLTSFPYPEGLTSRPMHVMYGLVCGFAAGWAYRIVKALLERKWDVKLPGDPDDRIGALLSDLPPDQLLKAHERVGALLLKAPPTDPSHG